ncbi:unnamed protein product [Prunus armeniaca]|uniref:Uncharacterized protein n=1 Tax=Prunus armeniaca TaxID=36596 RepID=A0A6J5TRY2_PRUAR|nr:unnamed protein product [Prunus armeniaca]
MPISIKTFKKKASLGTVLRRPHHTWLLTKRVTSPTLEPSEAVAEDGLDSGPLRQIGVQPVGLGTEEYM